MTFNPKRIILTLEKLKTLTKEGDTDMTFQEWLNKTYYEGFDASGLSDDEYYELEDAYRREVEG